MGAAIGILHAWVCRAHYGDVIQNKWPLANPARFSSGNAMFSGSIDNLAGGTFTDFSSSGSLRVTGVSGTVALNGVANFETVVLSGADYLHYWRLGRAGADAVDLYDEQHVWAVRNCSPFRRVAPMDRTQKPTCA